MKKNTPQGVFFHGWDGNITFHWLAACHFCYTNCVTLQLPGES